MHPTEDPIFRQLVDLALAEDLSPAGDLTTEMTILKPTRNKLEVRARKNPGIMSGSAYAALVFQKLDQELKVDFQVKDSQFFEPEAVLATIEGSTSSLLKGERLFLNLLQRAISIASYTNQFVKCLRDSKTKILDTRKTTPGLRSLEKKAVCDGGGHNHRFNLSSGVLIKDNHIALAGSIKAVLQAAKAKVGHLHKIEIEVDNLDQIKEVLDYGADVILLDNFSPTELEKAVSFINGRALTEASGGMDLNKVSQIAHLGLDFISVGSLTQAPPQIDIGLDY